MCVLNYSGVVSYQSVLFMRAIIIIIKRKSGSWSGQDQNIYLTNEVGTFLEREDILSGCHDFKG